MYLTESVVRKMITLLVSWARASGGYLVRRGFPDNRPVFLIVVEGSATDATCNLVLDCTAERFDLSKIRELRMGKRCDKFLRPRTTIWHIEGR